MYRIFSGNHRMIAAVLLAAIWLLSTAAQAMPPTEIGPLIDSARTRGELPVIVTLESPQLPDPDSMTPGALDATLRSASAAAQAKVLDHLPPTALRGAVKRFPFTPQFAARVTAEGLAALAAFEEVITIQEDIPEPPILDQSVPHVFPSQALSSYSGDGWAVAILDTGVDKHHDFLKTGAQQKVVSEACYSTTDPLWYSTSLCPDGASSSTAVDSAMPCVDLCRHGTHVAGIAAGDGSTFDGVAAGADLIAVQVFSRFTDPTCISFGMSSPCVLTWRSDQILALQRVYDLRTTYSIASANMSLGGGYYTDYCDSDDRKPTVDLLRSAGIATVIASSNDSYNDGVGAPGCISSAVTVGATSDTIDVRAGFSNNGPQLDLYAPGVSINSSIPGGGFSSWNGTSMATPHVAGAWAVLKQRYPARSVDEIEAAFKNTGVTINSYGISRQRIDIDQALIYYEPLPGQLYYPLNPCRIVDTRLTGGMIAAGTERDFIVSGTAIELQAQGGEGECGVPADTTTVALNITATQSASSGRFEVYPYGTENSKTSLLNFSAGMTIANAGVFAVCQPLCLKDITIYSSVDSHAVIDVMGYFK